jgi:hypothetical protein
MTFIMFSDISHTQATSVVGHSPHPSNVELAHFWFLAQIVNLCSALENQS